MKQRKQRLILEQVDRKLELFKPLLHMPIPSEGWIHTVRTALNMSLRQLGSKMGSSPQGIKGLEKSEKNGTITIQSLNDLAKALDLKLVYGFVPIDGSLDKMVKRKAMDMANQIISRTSNTMKLEDQENDKERISKALSEKANEIKNEMPKYLWE